MWVITRSIFLACAFVLFAVPAQASVLYPSVQDLQIGQGESKEIYIALQNDGNEKKSYSIDLIGVELGAEEGEYEFFELDETVRSWFALDVSSFELVSGEIREFVVAVAIPEQEVSQSQVVGVRVVESAAQGSSINVQSGFVSLAFLTVGDGIEESVDWLSYESSKSLSFGEVDTYLIVRNSGERFVQPNGLISLVSWTGKVVDQYIVNPQTKRIAEDQERTFQVFIQDDWALGPYELKLDVQPWESGEIYSDSAVVWFFSWKMSGLIIIGLILLFVFWRYAKKR